ncbi:hypothetical protein ACLB2K_042450 [Fragaria x ananassa]
MDGKLYAATRMGFVVLFDIQFHDGAPLTYRADSVVTFGPGPLIFSDELTPTIPWEVIAGTHLNIPYKTIQFGVFKLKPDDPDPQISPVFDLGDRILFVSRSGCKIMRTTSDALKYNTNGDQAQLLERNRIYFAFDDCVESASSEHEFGMFSLATKRVEFFPWPFLKNSSSRVRFNSRPVWFTPNL